MPKILLVDDEAVIITRLEEILSAKGFTIVGSATSGIEALRIAHEMRPDLILMDIVLDGEIDGITAAEKIKNELNIPVVFLSAHSDDEFLARAKRLEPYGYILKPFLAEQIIAAVDVALFKSEMEGRLREAEQKLLNAHRQLEKRVKERTKELKETTMSLQELNTALKVLLKRRDEDKVELEEKVLLNVRQLVLPFLTKLKRSGLSAPQVTYVNIVESNLADIISPLALTLTNKYFSLTPTEISVSNLVKQGKTTKEIGRVLNLSSKTVESHRKSIRRKLGLTNRKANLRSHLITVN